LPPHAKKRAQSSTRPGDFRRVVVIKTQRAVHVAVTPARDPDFNTADLAILTPLARVNPSYARRFFGAGRAG
jgi:hypothetical protein